MSSVLISGHWVQAKKSLSPGLPVIDGCLDQCNGAEDRSMVEQTLSIVLLKDVHFSQFMYILFIMSELSMLATMYGSVQNFNQKCKWTTQTTWGQVGVNEL